MNELNRLESQNKSITADKHIKSLGQISSEQSCGKEKQEQLLLKIEKLMIQAEKSCDETAINKYRQLYKACQNASETEISGIQKEYENIVYSQISRQSGINISTGIIKKASPAFKGAEAKEDVNHYSSEEREQILKEKGLKDKYYIRGMANTLSDEEFEQAIEVLNIGLKNLYNVKNIAKLSKKEYTKALRLLGYNIKEENITQLAQTEDEQFEKLIVRLKNGAPEELITLPDDAYERGMTLISMGIHPYTIKQVAVLSEEQFKKAIPFVDNEVLGSETVEIVENSDEEHYQRALNLLNLGVREGINELISDDYYDKAIMLTTQGFPANCTIIMVKEFDDEQINRALYLRNRGVNPSAAYNIANYDENTYNRILNNLQEGFSIHNAINMAINRDNTNPMPSINTDKPSKRDEIMEYIYSEEYITDISKAAQGKYTKSLVRMLNPKYMNYTAISDILNSGLTRNEYLASIKKISSSSYKLAMNTPNQYLSDIDTKYTKKQNGKYPKLSDGELAEQQEKVSQFFAENIGKMLRALKYIDTDTLNQMMDKRFTLFEEALKELDELTDENYELLSRLHKCKSENSGKDLTAREKIQLCQLMQIFQKAEIDKSILEKMAEIEVVNIDSIKQIITEEILKRAGITKEQLKNIPKEKQKLHEEYSYLILKNDSEKNCKDWQSSNGQLYTVLKAGIMGDFVKYITDETNEYGKNNAQTEKLYQSAGLNYEKWLNPHIKEISVPAGGKTHTIKLWERNPQKDLFMGNDTTCCTAIGTGANAAATPIYMLNTAFNVVQLKDENDNLVGMSRVFMANDGTKPVMIMDNMELNQTYIKNMSEDDLKTLRNGFFKYIKRYAQEVTGKEDTEIYMCGQDLKNVPVKDLKRKLAKINFTGEVSNELIYINSANCSWVNPQGSNMKKELRWFLAPKILD